MQRALDMTREEVEREKERSKKVKKEWEREREAMREVISGLRDNMRDKYESLKKMEGKQNVSTGHLLNKHSNTEQLICNNLSCLCDAERM